MNFIVYTNLRVNLFFCYQKWNFYQTYPKYTSEHFIHIHSIEIWREKKTGAWVGELAGIHKIHMWASFLKNRIYKKFICIFACIILIHSCYFFWIAIMSRERQRLTPAHPSVSVSNHIGDDGILYYNCVTAQTTDKYSQTEEMRCYYIHMLVESAFKIISKVF